MSILVYSSLLALRAMSCGNIWDVVHWSTDVCPEMSGFPLFNHDLNWEAVWLSSSLVSALIVIPWIYFQANFLGFFFMFKLMACNGHFWTQLGLLGISVGYDVYVILYAGTSAVFLLYPLFILEKTTTTIASFLLNYMRVTPSVQTPHGDLAFQRDPIVVCN